MNKKKSCDKGISTEHFIYFSKKNIYIYNTGCEKKTYVLQPDKCYKYYICHMLINIIFFSKIIAIIITVLKNYNTRRALVIITL